MSLGAAIAFHQKRNLVFVAVAVGLLIILFSGCASHPTRKELSRVTFGNSLEQVRETLKLPRDGRHFRSSFRVSTTNGVLEMISVFCEEAGGEWNLLFQDGRFVSTRPGQQYQANKGWPGFTNPQDPDFNELAWYWKDFFPPAEPKALLPLHTNVVCGPSLGRAENTVWGIYMIPLLPLFAVVAPIYYLATYDDLAQPADLTTRFKIQPGMTESQVAKLLGWPCRQIGNERRSVYWCSMVDVSVGFDNGRAAFVFFDVNICPPEPGTK